MWAAVKTPGNSSATVITRSFPSVVQSYVPMPGLTGIEVRKFSVGTLLSGSLFYGEVDAVIDQFDLPSLALSLMLPSNESFPLPTSDQLQRRIILDDVFCPGIRGHHKHVIKIYAFARDRKICLAGELPAYRTSLAHISPTAG